MFKGGEESDELLGVQCFRVEKRVMKSWVFEGGEEGDKVLGV